MKKVSIILFLLILGIAFKGFSQAPAPSDFFVGKWNMTVPNQLGGEETIQMVIIKRAGKLTVVDLGRGNFINIRIVEERATELSILVDFVTNEYMPKESLKAKDMPITLTKVDDDTLTLKMDLNPGGPEQIAKRVK